MKYTSAFDIIGPVMVGPSSSHTAGAVRMGNIARQVLAEPPLCAEFRLMGSFATTYRGHGTDVALLAGVMNLSPEEDGVPVAKQIASDVGLSYSFEEDNLGYFHPNTVRISLLGRQRQVDLVASSIGGGKVEVQELDGLPLKFSGDRPTLLLYHQDAPGFLAKVCRFLDVHGYNIGRLVLERWRRGGNAVALCEVDGKLPPGVLQELRAEIGEVSDLRLVCTNFAELP